LEVEDNQHIGTKKKDHQKGLVWIGWVIESKTNVQRVKELICINLNNRGELGIFSKENRNISQEINGHHGKEKTCIHTR
jgi:hypothetical protein